MASKHECLNGSPHPKIPPVQQPPSTSPKTCFSERIVKRLDRTLCLAINDKYLTIYKKQKYRWMDTNILLYRLGGIHAVRQITF